MRQGIGLPLGHADVLASKPVFVDGHSHVAVLEIEELSQREPIVKLSWKAEGLLDVGVVVIAPGAADDVGNLVSLVLANKQFEAVDMPR